MGTRRHRSVHSCRSAWIRPRLAPMSRRRRWDSDDATDARMPKLANRRLATIMSTGGSEVPAGIRRRQGVAPLLLSEIPSDDDSVSLITSSLRGSKEVQPSPSSPIMSPTQRYMQLDRSKRHHNGGRLCAEQNAPISGLFAFLSALVVVGASSWWGYGDPLAPASSQGHRAGGVTPTSHLKTLLGISPPSLFATTSWDSVGICAVAGICTSSPTT